MISIGILLFLAALMVIIFTGRIFECMLRKFRNREQRKPASNQPRRKIASFYLSSSHPNLQTKDS
jgi:hypothetical protein